MAFQTDRKVLDRRTAASAAVVIELWVAEKFGAPAEGLQLFL
jgi:hypothetical protein